MKRHIESLVSRLETCEIGAIDPNGYPIMKTVMAPRKHEGLNTMYFTTLMSSYMVASYKNNPKASVYFVDAERFQSALFTGVISIEEDPEIIESLKATETGKIFKGDAIDTNYCVLKFTAEKVSAMVNFETSLIEL